MDGSLLIRSYQREDIDYIIGRLMKTVIGFCKEKGYRHIFLWTVDILEAARHLYQAYGFTLTETVENDAWTDGVIKEECWDLPLK